MFIITTVPVCLGLFINSRFNSFSISFQPFSNKLSTFLFILIVLAALISEWVIFLENLYLLGPCIVVLICIMLFIGYNSPKFFGINSKQSKTIAIESGIQNGTVGIAIGNIILNQTQGLSILSLPSGVYSILMYIVCLPIIFLVLKK